MSAATGLVETARRTERPTSSSVAATQAVLRRGAAAVEAMLASVANRGFSSRLLPDPAGPVVVLSPHLDDAVLSCWSVLAAAEPVQAVNVFAAPPRPGFVTRYDRICGARDSAVHIRVRIEEDRDALGALGRSPLNLPFLDRQYRRPWQTPSLKQLDDEIVQVVPRVRAVYAPAALGFAPQPDHALVRALALNMAANGVAVWLYADVPYATTFGWPHWVSETPENPFLDVDAYWQPLVAAVPAVGSIRAARVVRLQAPEASRKLAAMEAYRTQFPALDGGPIGALRNPLVHGFEVFWRIGAET